LKRIIYVGVFVFCLGSCYSAMRFNNVQITGKTRASSNLAEDYLSLTIRPGLHFAATSYVHQQLADDAPLDAKSAIYVSSIVAQRAAYTGVATVNISQYTPAIFIVPPDQSTCVVRAWDRNNGTLYPLAQAKWNSVPIPDNFVAASGTDQEAVIYQPSTGKMWEFWLLQNTTATVVSSTGGVVKEWGARWGGRMDDIARNPGYFQTENGGDWFTSSGTKFGTTATSLAFLAGILTIEEQQSGVINHAIGVSLPEVYISTGWRFPANRSDGTFLHPNAIREGTTFRFPYDLDLSTFGMKPYGLMIARAIQKYGMVVWDKSGAVNFRAENPANQYPGGSPYTKIGGILNCPTGVSTDDCFSDDHSYGNGGQLLNFPWNKLQALAGTDNQ